MDDDAADATLPSSRTAPRPPPAAESVEAVFDRFDADNSGDIDVVELRNALVALSMPVDTAQAGEVMKKYDADHSRRLDVDEFRTLVEQLRAHVECRQLRMGPEEGLAHTTEPAPACHRMTSQLTGGILSSQVAEGNSRAGMAVHLC